MTKRHTVLPEVLGKRSELDHVLYGAGQEAYDLFSVSILIGSGTKRHVVNAPQGNDETSRRLRRYALALSRFALPMASITKRAKVADVRPQTVKSAIRAMAQATYSHSFRDDATIGTVNATMVASPLVDVMKGRSPDIDSVVAALSLSGTQAFDEVMRYLGAQATDTKDKDFVAKMLAYGSETSNYWLSQYDIAQYERINRAKGTWERRAGIKAYDMLAKHLERKADQLIRLAHRPRANNNRRPGDQPPGTPERHDRVTYVEESKGWVPFRLSKPDLTVSHTGKLGRRVIRGQEGKYPHYIDRLVTDPERRIFRKKTRSLGAVVVLDCSGSMGWSESDIDKLIQSCSGATILAYSSGGNDDEPNAWVVARRNQRVRRLPDFPGGNGVDGPALRYAVSKLRTSSVNPVIWVSDQRVTGLGDVPSQQLRAETDALVKRHGIYVTEDLRQTLRLVTRLQGK
jgi:hypothetical protein